MDGSAALRHAALEHSVAAEPAPSPLLPHPVPVTAQAAREHFLQEQERALRKQRGWRGLLARLKRLVNRGHVAPAPPAPGSPTSATAQAGSGFGAGSSVGGGGGTPLGGNGAAQQEVKAPEPVARRPMGLTLDVRVASR